MPERSSRSRCAPASAASPCARACCSRARRAGGSSARSWSTTPPTSAPWLDCAREAADVGWPDAGARQVPVNVTVPACDPERAREIVLGLVGLPDGQGQGRRARPGTRARTRPGSRRSATRSVPTGWSGSTPTAAGPSTRRSAAIPRPGAGRRRAGVRRAAGRLASRTSPSCAAGSTCRSPPTSRSAGRPTPIGCATSRRPTSPYSRCSRSAAYAPACGSPRTSACRWSSRSAVESSIGIAAGVALAAALPELPHACGLATVQLLTGDVVADPLLPVDGALPVRRPDGRPRPARRAGRRARPGGALAPPDGRGRGRAAGSSLVSPPPSASVHRARDLAGRPARRARADRRRALPRVAQRAALVRAGAPTTRVTLHTRIDERTAAFLALGIAKVLAPARPPW